MELSLDENGRTREDLYVHLPTQDRFVCFVKKGDEFEERKINSLSGHADPHVYVRNVDLKIVPEENVINYGKDKKISAEPTPEPPAIQALKAPAHQASMKISDLTTAREDISEKLVKVFKGLKDPATFDLSGAGDTLGELAGGILDVVAPEASQLHSTLLKQSSNIDLMHDSSAILCLAVLFTVVNGFSSRNIFKDLSFATLLMDMTLVEFPQDKLHGYYKDRKSLEGADLATFKKHPMDSFTLVNNELKNINDTIRQLILCHHELYNGKGFPRGQRSESLPPIARILSLAVDTFETMKGYMLRGEKLELLPALNILLEKDCEPHLRRHSRKLVDNTIKALVMDPEKLAIELSKKRA